MIELKGTSEEIAEAIKAISRTYPSHVIKELNPGEWHFSCNGVDTLVLIEEEGDAG